MRYLFSFVVCCSLLFASVSCAKELLVFGADWCPNCVQLKKAIEKDPDIVVDFEVLIVDVDQEPTIARAYDVHKIPALIVREPGGFLRRKVGFRDAADLKKWLKNAN